MLIEAPRNVETYLALQFWKRKRLFKDQCMANWIGFLEKDPSLRWVIRWWRLHGL